MLAKLQQLKDALIDARTRKSILDGPVRDLQDWFKKKHEGLFSTHAGLKVEVIAKEDALREALVEHFNDDPEKNKAPLPGLGIREETVYEYDEPHALDWVISRGMTELYETKLKKEEFEKTAAVLRPDFVTIKKVPAGTISRDLTNNE